MGIVGLYNKFDSFAHKVFSTRFAKNTSKHYKEMYKKMVFSIENLVRSKRKKLENFGEQQIIVRMSYIIV